MAARSQKLSGRRRLSSIQVISLGVALVLGFFMLTRRVSVVAQADGELAPSFSIEGPEPAFAAKTHAPEKPTAALDLDAGATDAGAGLGHPAAAAHDLDASVDALPIDLAIAPDGGVPFHPGATGFKSPFAKPNAAPPVRAKVGMVLNTVDDYDVKTGTFTADFFLSLTSATPMPELHLKFPNGKVEDTEILADKPTFRLYRMQGTFKSPPDLRKYPFDSQDLKILIEDDYLGIDQIRFSADKERTQLARGFRVLGWQVDSLSARSLSQSYPDRFENDDLYYNRYIFTLGLERFATSAAFTVYVPAFVIVIISLLGMWVPAEEMEVRSNAGAPMLAGAVLFHFSLTQELPATSYLTRADKLMLGVYICLMLGMLSTWVMFLVKDERIPLVFRIARVSVPLLSVLVMAMACLG